MGPTLGFKLPLTGGLPMWPHGRTAGEWAALAEDRGYDSVWLSEAWGGNAFIYLAEVAAVTESVRFGTAIANVYSRTPPVLAMAGASLARLSDGRAVLGLGASHPGVVKRLHGLDYSRPVRRIHETAEAIHALTDAGKSVSYDGQTFSTEGFPGLDEPVPIYNAALGEANRRATGRVADGWLPYLLPFSELDDAFETIERTAREASRDPDAIETLPQVLAVVDEDPDAARRPIREYLANYVGNYANYRRIVAEQFSDEVAAITEAWEAGNEATAVSRVTDEMVREFGVAGPPETARDQLQAILDRECVDAAMVYVPNGVCVDTIERTVKSLSPDAF